MPAYSVVCTTFSISLASLRVINPSLVCSLDFIALPGCSHLPSLVTAQQSNMMPVHRLKKPKMVSGQTSLINFL